MVVQPAAKHLGGHSDLLAGALATNDGELAETFALAQTAQGGVLAPQDSFRLFPSVRRPRPGASLLAERPSSSIPGSVGIMVGSVRGSTRASRVDPSDLM